MVSALSGFLGWEGETVGECGSGGLECEIVENWGVGEDWMLQFCCVVFCFVVLEGFLAWIVFCCVLKLTKV